MKIDWIKVLCVGQVIGKLKIFCCEYQHTLVHLLDDIPLVQFFVRGSLPSNLVFYEPRVQNIEKVFSLKRYLIKIDVYKKGWHKPSILYSCLSEECPTVTKCLHQHCTTWFRRVKYTQHNPGHEEKFRFLRRVSGDDLQTLHS